MGVPGPIHPCSVWCVVHDVCVCVVMDELCAGQRKVCRVSAHVLGRLCCVHAIGLRCFEAESDSVYVVCVRCCNQNMDLSRVRGRERSFVCVRACGYE